MNEKHTPYTKTQQENHPEYDDDSNDESIGSKEELLPDKTVKLPEPLTRKQVLTAELITPEDVEAYIDITESMKSDFLDSALESKPFTKEYEVIPGKYSVVLRSLSVGEQDSINRDIENEVRKSDGKISYSAAADAVGTNLKHMLVTVTIDGTPVKWGDEKGKNIFIENMPVFIHDRIRRLAYIFSILIQKLQLEVFSTNF